MAVRRSIARAPTELPVIEEHGATTREWERWFSLIAEHAFKRYHYHTTINPTSVGANTTSEQTFSIAGVTLNDFVLVIKPTHTAGLGIVNVRVPADGSVAITFMNCTAGAIDPPEEEYDIFVMKV